MQNARFNHAAALYAAVVSKQNAFVTQHAWHLAQELGVVLQDVPQDGCPVHWAHECLMLAWQDASPEVQGIALCAFWRRFCAMIASPRK